MPNPQNLKPWTPAGGENPPPASPGRPRKRPQSEASEEYLRMELPEIMRVQLNTIMKDGRPHDLGILKKGATFADAIAYGLGKKAMMGDAAAAKELADRVEGKSTQRIELMSHEERSVEITVQFERTVEPRKDLDKLIHLAGGEDASKKLLEEISKEDGQEEKTAE